MRKTFSIGVAVLTTFLGMVVMTGSTAGAVVARPSVVPQDCSGVQPYFPPLTTEQASVQPGVIVPDYSGFPFIRSVGQIGSMEHGGRDD